MAETRVAPAPQMEYAFRIRMMLGTRRKLGQMPFGAMRGFVTAAGGEVTGPLLNGRVVPNSGGDWALYRPDGTVQFDARYMLEADDGALILMHNIGYRHAPPDVLAKMEALEPVERSQYYFRVTPRFETPKGKHDWLTRNILVGTVERNADHSVFDYYVVR